MERMGVPRHVLLDVISAVLREVAEELKQTAPNDPAAESSVESSYQRITPDTVPPEMHGAVRATIEGMDILDPALRAITKKHDVGVTVSAMASHLAILLRELKSHSAEGAQLCKVTLDGLLRVIETGESGAAVIQNKRKN